MFELLECKSQRNLREVKQRQMTKRDNVLTPKEFKEIKVAHQKTKRGKKKRKK